MAVKRKSLPRAERGPLDAAKTSTPKQSYPRPLDGPDGESHGDSPAHLLRARIIAEYAEQEEEKWPPAVRFVIIAGGALGMWAAIGSAIFAAMR
jgi:hypothetical protein